MAGTKTRQHAVNIGKALHQKFVDTQDRELLGKMIALYKDGNCISAVAAQSGKPIATTYRWLKAAGIQMRPASTGAKGKPWSEARREATPAKEKPVRVVVDGIALRGAALITNRSLGNKSRSAHGYITIHVGRKRKQYEHIIVAEKALGRPIRKGEVVHHINCDRTDNRPENLLVCRIGYHLQLHARMRKHPYWNQF
jgi:hypothetical protein